MSAKVLAVVIFVVAASAVAASPAKKSNYIEQENSCREVCGLCECDGFYCEDECICECSLQDDENLQCIADMEKECDANGLEYELVMQESAKERFLREVKGSPSDLSKHLVILKQKRQSVTSEPTVGATPTTEATVGATQSTSATTEENKVGMPLSAFAASIGGKAAIAGKTAVATLTAPKLLVLMRERISNAFHARPSVAPFTLPKITVTTTAAPKFALPKLPTFGPVQPAWLQ